MGGGLVLCGLHIHTLSIIALLVYYKTYCKCRKYSTVGKRNVVTSVQVSALKCTKAGALELKSALSFLF